MEPINILFFQNSIQPSHGGVPRVSSVISKELEARGYACFFAYYLKDSADYAPNVKLKVDINNPYSQIENSVFDFIIQNKINFFICQNAYLPVFIRLYARIREVYPNYPFYTFLHAAPDYWQSSFRSKHNIFSSKGLIEITKNIIKKAVYPFYNPYIRSTKSLYNLSDKFILLSKTFLDSFCEIYGIDKQDNKLIAIPNPLTFSSSLNASQLASKEKIVLIVSRLADDQKKISVALEIWKQAMNYRNNEWKLVIVGSGPDEAYYKNMVADYKLDNVVFMGHQDEVQQYYLRSSIFLMTSIWEGLPMSILEAQQNGVVPIVFDNFSAVHDVISDSHNGFIIRDNNQELFKDKLVHLMENSLTRRAMAMNAVTSSERFQVSRVVSQWENELIREKHISYQQ
jgi:glycosyltransferase involved in cell wall biosynthesis